MRRQYSQADLAREHIRWETLVFVMPDDGSGSLPLLRHVIVNDNKSSTYKLGLLRTLVRLAETAPGLVFLVPMNMSISHLALSDCIG